MKIVIIQTAFLGDVILSTALAESLHQKFPLAQIDFVVRKGNESLFKNHPFVRNIFAWNKRENKIRGLFKILHSIQKEKYDLVLNLQRFFSSGLLAGFSKGKEIRGFTKNPLSFLYTKKYDHKIGNGSHEVSRNQLLIDDMVGELTPLPKLYPPDSDFKSISEYQQMEYVCLAPSSVWFTKQMAKEKWVGLIQKRLAGISIYLLGSNHDFNFCEDIRKQSNSDSVINLSGKLSLLQTAALMSKAKMNYVNDSAPLHIASAMNAPVTAFFCSTVPEFGFYPLSDVSIIKQITEPLNCKPCGLHGYRECPKGHFKCGRLIEV